MPFNSFDNYNMTWKPQKANLSSPYYLSIAKLLEEDIVKGRFPANMQLPPQRELADYLDLNLSTITRAYKICEKKGLVCANIGRGTFISPNVTVPTTVLENNSMGLIEMGMVLPFNESDNMIRNIALEILNKTSTKGFFNYDNPFGDIRQRETALQWIKKDKISADIENILITAGAQNALAIILTSLFTSGNKIVTDSYTYANFIGLAKMLNIELFAVESDYYGMIPSKLENACRINNIQGIYLMPTCNNPTNTRMDSKRKEEMAFVIKKNKLILIEDDIYSFLFEDNKLPIAHYIPENTISISSVSKSLCPGLRVAYMSFPSKYKPELERGVNNINLKTPSLNIEIITEIINKGLDQNMINKKKELSRARNRIFSDIFNIHKDKLSFHPNSYYQWFWLPNNYPSKEFEMVMAKRGVRIYGSERFAVGNISKRYGFRVATSSPNDEMQLKKGLKLLKDSYELINLI